MGPLSVSPIGGPISGSPLYIFSCVVKTHICSTEAIDNVGLYNDVVIRAYNTDVLVIRGLQCYIIK